MSLYNVPLYKKITHKMKSKVFPLFFSASLLRFIQIYPFQSHLEHVLVLFLIVLKLVCLGPHNLNFYPQLILFAK